MMKLIIHSAQRFRHPDIHVALSAMCPCIIGISVSFTSPWSPTSVDIERCFLYWRVISVTLNVLAVALRIGNAYRRTTSNCGFWFRNGMMQIETLVIRALGTIDQRTALHCHLYLCRLCHLIVGNHHAGLYVEMNAYHIALLPLTGYLHITPLSMLPSTILLFTDIHT